MSDLEQQSDWLESDSQVTKPVREKPLIAVWFSCGAASAVAAKKTIERYGNTHEIRIVNNPVIEEDFDNRRFLQDVEKWLGIEIEIAAHPKFPPCSAVSAWDNRKFMSAPDGAPCTKILKKEVRQHWEMMHRPDHHVLGFTADEQKRHDHFVLTERELLPVLIDAKLTKGDCFKIVSDAGIELPRIYKMGYPNANCIGCVKATSPTYGITSENSIQIFSGSAQNNQNAVVPDWFELMGSEYF